MSVPFLAGPLFAPTSNFTVPDPLPLAPLVTVIHEMLLAAVHVQPFVVVTPTDCPVTADAATDIVSGLTVNEHGCVTPGCVTVTVVPATVSVPFLELPVFAGTLKVTVPLPVRLAPAVMVIHDVAVLAVQLHDAVVVTVTERVVLPPTGALIVVGLTPNEQLVAALWLMVTTVLPIVIVPCRAAPLFVATEKATDALPVPLVGDWIVIQAALVVTDHAHVVVNDRDPPPPAAGTFCVSGLTPYVHPGPPPVPPGASPPPVPAAACVSVNDWPAIVTVPERVPPGLPSTRSSTTPAPSPDDPDVIEIHGDSLDALQAHPVGADTFTR